MTIKWYVAATVYTVYGGLLAIVFMRLLRGEIRTDGLLAANENRVSSPERVQLMVGGLFTMAAYTFEAISHFHTAAHPSSTGAAPRMPEPSSWLVASLAGTNALYLVGKVSRLFRGST